MGAAPLVALGCNGLRSTSGRHTLPSGLTQTVTGTGPGSQALAVVATASPTARLFADVDRNGKIDLSDDASRDQWSAARGAIFSYNDDDDDADKIRDSDDNKLNGAEDRRNMARLVVGQLSSNPLTVKLTYSPGTAPVRVFKYDSQSGALSEVIQPGAGDTGILVNNNEVVGGEVNFFVESAGPKTTAWDGFVTFTLDVAGSQGSQDKVKMCVAPLILTDNTQPAIHVRAMVIPGDNDPFINALKAGLQSQSVTFIPVDHTTYQDDRWVQDDFESGFTGYVDTSGNYVYVEQYNRLERGRGLGPLIPNEIMGKNKGHIYAGAGAQEGCNYGGNLEVIPAHNGPSGNYPFGRIYVGGGDAGTVTGQQLSRHMNKEQVDLMNAQGMQGPVIEISSEWLGVGHVDEFSMSVLDKAAAGGHAFKIAWASPDLAYAALTAMANKGLGTAVVYNGRKSQTTVAAILADTQLRQYNVQVQARLDSNKQKLMAACGLTASDFCEFPVYYEIMQGSGADFAISQNPGSQNCIPVNDTLYVPDPEGPDDAGKDVWQAQIDQALAPLGIHAVYVDVFTSYHELAGEAHCGSNTFYTPYSTPWWNR